MELYHHGIKGMKWGVRRYQNANGSLTAAGKEHYNHVSKKMNDINKREQIDIENDLINDTIAKLDKKYSNGKNIDDLISGCIKQGIMNIKSKEDFNKYNWKKDNVLEVVEDIAGELAWHHQFKAYLDDFGIKNISIDGVPPTYYLDELDKYLKSENITHSGIKGMKWGVRRWQNEDGSLTEAGRAHYGIKQARMEARIEKAKLKRAKIEAKNAKSQSAYATGKKFGDAFIPAIGKSFGESFGRNAGEAMGSIANPFKWKQSKIDATNAEAAKLKAEAEKMDKNLSKKKYEEGYTAKQQELDFERNKTARLTAESAVQKQITDAKKLQFDMQKWAHDNNFSIRRENPVSRETIKNFQDRIDNALKVYNNPYAPKEAKTTAAGAIASINALIKNDNILSMEINIPDEFK